MSASGAGVPGTTRSRTATRRLVVGGVLVACSTFLVTFVVSLDAGRLDATRAAIASAGAVSIAAMLSTVEVVRFRRRSGAVSFSGTVLILGLLAWTLGATLFVVEAAGVEPLASWGLADATYLVAGAMLVLFASSHPRLGNRSRRLRTLLDATIVAVSCSVLFWLLLGRSLLERTSDVDNTVSAFLLPATDVVVIFAMLSALAASVAQPVRRTSLMLVIAAMVATLAADLVGLAARAHDLHPVTTLVAGASMVIGVGLFGAAAHVAGGESGALRLGAPRRALADTLAAAPVLAAVVAASAVLTDAAWRGSLDATATIVLTVVVCAVLARQSVTLADNRQLAASLQRTIDDLELQATHDTLTGQPNRFGLTERIDEAVALATAERRCAALLFLDVDHLKAVNDSLGHQAGDLLIQATATRLAARAGQRVTRFGGDEFVVLADDLSGPSAATALGRAVVDDVSQPVDLDGRAVSVSASVGIAIAEPGLPAEELLRRADIALYRAKAMGRRCVSTYHPSEDEGRSRIDLGPELRRAVEREELTLHYQPIVELATGAIVAAEALLRWNHPERGLLTPETFLDEAITEGLLGSIGERSLRRACADFASFVPERSPQLPRSVAVNLSSSELVDRRVTARVAAALRDAALPPDRLTLEITEDVIVDETVHAAIERLGALGVRLAVDDFGTGNSSLRQLGAYPAQKLKIDRSFVDRLEADPKAVAVVRALVLLASHLGMVTVAEGVETEGQARLLAELGCDRGQGWLFARAMPFEALVAFCDDYSPVERCTPRPLSTSSAPSMMRASSSATVGRSSIAPTT